VNHFPEIVMEMVFLMIRITVPQIIILDKKILFLPKAMDVETCVTVRVILMETRMWMAMMHLSSRKISEEVYFKFPAKVATLAVEILHVMVM
jgi:hypothetical protein